MKRHNEVSIAVMGLLVVMLAISMPVWAQKSKPPQPPPPPPDPAIAYVAERGWSTTDLMVMNADGSNQRVLLAGGTGPTSIGYHSPSWSPDSNRIAFCRNTQWGADNGIYLINKDGSGQCKVVVINEACSYGAGWPTWSPDGSKILYSDTEGPGLNEDLYLVDATCNADPASRINLTNTPDIAEFYPALSADGTRIVTVVVPNPFDLLLYDLVPDPQQGWKAVFVVNLTASGPYANYGFHEPKWAPTTNRIATSAGEILVIDVTSPFNPTFSNLTQTPEAVEYYPTWSPFDRQIAFVRDNNIYVMDADGRNVKLLVSGQRKVRLTDLDWRRTP